MPDKSTDRIATLKEKIGRLEFTLARTGDEYLKKVCRSDIDSMRKKLTELENTKTQ
jgi:hypothetical protein